MASMIYRGVKMKDDTEKKKGRRDVLKTIGIATVTILSIAVLVIVIREFGIR